MSHTQRTRNPLTAVRTRLAMSAREDRGAQAMEYALLGGVSVAGCSALAFLFDNEQFQQFLGTVLGTLGDWITSVL